jgi:hypothetical protein
MSAPTSIFSGSDIDDHWRLKASPLRSIAGIGQGGIGQGGSSDTTTMGRAGQSGAIGRGITCSTSCGQMTERSSRYGQRRFRSCHRAELFGRIVRVHRRGPRLARGHTGKAGRDMSSQPWAAGSLRWVSVSHRTLMAWRLLSAIMLLVMGGIHLYLVFHGVGGLLGGLFVVNAVGAVVLAIAIIVLRGRLLLLATGLSLLFMVGTLLALVLALTVGLFGIREVLSFKLVPTTLVVESIGTIILAITVALVLRSRRAP